MCTKSIRFIKVVHVADWNGFTGNAAVIEMIGVDEDGSLFDFCGLTRACCEFKAFAKHHLTGEYSCQSEVIELAKAVRALGANPYVLLESIHADLLNNGIPEAHKLDLGKV